MGTPSALSVETVVRCEKRDAAREVPLKAEL